MIGRSAAISVRGGDRGLLFANSGPLGFAAENRSRSVALDLVFGAPGRHRRRRGATRFREPDGLRGGGSVGRFVRDLSVPGRASRRNGAVELAPAVCGFAGGTPVPGSLCEVAPEGWGRLLAVGLAPNQHLDRPRIASRFGVGLVVDRSVRTPVTRTNSVSLRSPRPSQVATSFTIFRWTASRS